MSRHQLPPGTGGVMPMTWIAILILASCVTSRVTTAPNPASPPRDLRNLVVWVDFADLGLRQRTERNFAYVAEVETPVATAFHQAHTLFFAGRQPTPQELADGLKRVAADAILFVRADAVGTSTGYVPPVLTNVGGNAVLSGGTLTQSPWGNYSAYLMDLETGEVAWFATAAVQGNALSGPDAVLNHMVTSIMEAVVKDGYLARRQR